MPPWGCFSFLGQKLIPTDRLSPQGKTQPYPKATEPRWMATVSDGQGPAGSERIQAAFQGLIGQGTSTGAQGRGEGIVCPLGQDQKPGPKTLVRGNGFDGLRALLKRGQRGLKTNLRPGLGGFPGQPEVEIVPGGPYRPAGWSEAYSHS